MLYFFSYYLHHNRKIVIQVSVSAIILILIHNDYSYALTAEPVVTVTRGKIATRTPTKDVSYTL